MTLIVQLRLRNTHNLVGARSSCSIGVPRADSISFSLRPIRRSTPCVPISARLLSLSSAFSLSSTLLSSAGKAADFRAGAGGRAGSLTPAAAGPVTSSGMLVRSSAGGELSAQPKVSSTAAKPSHRRMRRQFMPVSATANAPMQPARNGAEARPCPIQTGSEFAALDRHAARPQARAYSATNARRDRSVTERASRIWPNCGTRADFAWQTNRLEPFPRPAAKPGFGARS